MIPKKHALRHDRCLSLNLTLRGKAFNGSVATIPTENRAYFRLASEQPVTVAAIAKYAQINQGNVGGAKTTISDVATDKIPAKGQIRRR